MLNQCILAIFLEIRLKFFELFLKFSSQFLFLANARKIAHGLLNFWENILIGGYSELLPPAPVCELRACIHYSPKPCHI